MYDNHLFKICSPKFEVQNSLKETHIYIICTDFLEFVAAKFNLNLAFVQFLSVCID